MIIIVTVVLLLFLAFAILKFIVKWLVRKMVRKNLVREFEEELDRRLRIRIHLEPADDELIQAVLRYSENNSSDLIEEKINRMREEERAKMLKEENLGLK